MLGLVLFLLLFAPTSGGLDDRLSKWKPVKMPFNAQALTPSERQVVEKLVEAAR